MQHAAATGLRARNTPMAPLAVASPTRLDAPLADAAARPRVCAWELVQLAAAGPLAETYRARPVHGPQDGTAAYALKLLRPEWQDDPRAVRLFRREWLVGRSVRHPHLICVLSASVQEAPCFVVTPWLPGRTLAERLAGQRDGAGLPRRPADQSSSDARPWTPDLPVGLWIARQTAEALGALHEAGWMHGDVKPENIHLSPEGHVTLLDLGFARRPDETGSAVDRCVLGTAAYLAPETVASALRTDIRSDIYSLGVVLFEMFAGRLPFRGRTLAEMVRLHRQERPPDLRRVAPHLPTGVVRLVREMLAKEPLRRPQTPRELTERLVALEVFAFAERRG